MSLTQTPLSGVEAVLTGLVVLIVVAFEETWVAVRYVIVMAHEGAHAITGSLLFRGLQGITLDMKSGGETKLVLDGSLPGTVLFKFAGYIGPSLFGLGAALLIKAGFIASMLWVTLFLLGILLLCVRRSFGWVTVILVGGLVFVIAHFAPMKTQVVAAYAIAWLLLLSGVRRIFEIGLGSGDGGDLRKLTFIPHLIWSVLWLAGALAAVAFGGRMLVMGA